MKMMTRVLFGLLLFCVVAGAQGNEEKYKKKLAKDFATKVAWEKTLESAKTKAAKENKLIFAYFTRSYSP